MTTPTPAPQRHRTSRRSCRAFVPFALLAFALGGTSRAGASLFTVTNVNDSGAGSLREAILGANADAASPHSITISIAGAGPHTVTPATALPTITRPTAITAFIESISGAPGVVLDGSAIATAGTDGLAFGSSADGSSVAYLAIVNFTGDGIDIASDTTSVSNSYVGLASDGATAAGNDGNGVLVKGLQATVGGGTATRNVISGNGGDGVQVSASGGFSVVRGNYIGTDAAGTAAVPNAGDGVQVGAAAGVTVGGNSAGEGNVVAGNSGSGIIFSSGSSFGGAQGNLVGVAASGTAALGNGGTGIWVTGNDILVGSTSAAGRNVIAANSNQGILINGGAANTAVRGNYIGLDITGTTAIAGQTYGIRATGTVTDCTIGGPGPTYRNVISASARWAISLESAVSGCVVSANYIGTNAAGTAAVNNLEVGIDLGGTNNVVGGDSADERNVISGNDDYGIVMHGATNKVQGNYIGLNAAGSAALANGRGIRVIGATGGTIGGTLAGEGNVISGNLNDGLVLDGDTAALTIAGNYVGTNPAGTAAIGNGGGISLRGTGHTLGGSSAAARNVISGNANGGVGVHGSGHFIRGNHIGTNAAGTAAIPGSGSNGIRVLVASAITIGGTGAGEGNLISGNNSFGIVLDDESSDCTVVGNKIGTNAAGDAALPNGDGIGVNGSGQTVGGATAAARNLISGNDGYGLFATGTGHVISGNYVGVNAAGTAAIGNGSYGLRADTLIDSTIGGLATADGNVFGGNGRGLNLGYGSHGNAILNNIIGLDATATVNLADNATGIEIADSFDNQIGQAGDGNVIAGMTYSGIGFQGDGATGNVVQGNWIGTNKVLASGLGNAFAGVFVGDSSGNTIGGTGAGEGNVIANNYQFGVRVERGDGNEISGNSIYGNYFGIDVDELGFFPNDGGDGDDGGNQAQNYPLIASAVVNGGTTDVAGLLISEPNTQYRIEFFSSPTCNPVGFGDGKTYRGSTLVTTGGGGQVAIATSIPQAIPDAFLTATAVDPAGNTSEFSPCAEIDLGENPGRFQFDRAAYVGYENVIATTKIFVTRSHGLSGTATVNFSTSNSTAVAGSDYTDSDQVLSFAAWEVVKIVDVPILYDPAVETNPEKFLLSLTSPSAGAALGSLPNSEVQIWDYTPADPGLTVGDAFVTEGDSGQALLVFDVNLTATDHQVKVTYLTEPGTTEEGVDYTHVLDVITFPPSTETQTVQVEVPVWGDTDVEADEIVWLRITTAAGGGNWIAYDVYGRGEIRNDDDNGVDPVPSNVIFADGFEIGSSALWSATMPVP